MCQYRLTKYNLGTVSKTLWTYPNLDAVLGRLSEMEARVDRWLGVAGRRKTLVLLTLLMDWRTSFSLESMGLHQSTPPFASPRTAGSMAYRNFNNPSPTHKRGSRSTASGPVNDFRSLESGGGRSWRSRSDSRVGASSFTDKKEKLEWAMTTSKVQCKPLYGFQSPGLQLRIRKTRSTCTGNCVQNRGIAERTKQNNGLQCHVCSSQSLFTTIM